MIGLDTSVLVRYLTQDDPEQGAAAALLIESRCTRDAPGYVALTVLCELVWVLRKAYGYDRALIGSVLEKILISAELDVEGEDVVWCAVQAYRDGPADFADYVIVHGNRRAGCEITYTFDQKLARHEQAASVGEDKPG